MKNDKRADCRPGPFRLQAVTRTVVAAVDRGNYPVVSFQTVDGDTHDWYPSLIATRGDEYQFGLDAAC
jgi:hypothetical protein